MNKYLEQLGIAIQRRPLLSTTIGAFLTSSIWTFTWMTMFFLVTFLSELETSKGTFIVMMFLSVLVEATGRYTENRDSISFYNKPHHGLYAKGDNKNFTLGKLSIIIITGLFFVFVFGYGSSSDIGLIQFQAPGSFVGLSSKSGIEGFPLMIRNWRESMSDPSLQVMLLVVFLLRMFLYKKEHRKHRYVIED